MEKLHYFGPKAAALLKLTGPVSSLLIEGMSGILKGDSEELKSLHLLHDQIEDNFAKLSYKVDSIIISNNYNNYMDRYQKKISIGLKLLSLEFEFLTNSSYHSVDPSIMNDLRRQCNSENSVLNMLTWLEQVIDTNSELPSVLHSSNYIKAFEFVNFIEYNLKKDDKLHFHINSTIFKRWKSIVISRLFICQKKIKVLKKYFDEGNQLNITNKIRNLAL